MVWGLEWGGKVEFLKTLVEQGQQVAALENRPRLKPWLSETYQAFQILSNSRTMTMGGVGPIPLSEMAAYLSMFGDHGIEEREHFVRTMQALDSVYLKHVNKSQAQKPTQKKRRR